MKSETAPLAYLLSEYPTVTHSYILREIRALEALGLSISRASISRPGGCGNTEAEREETNRTFYVKDAPKPGIVRDVIGLLVARPRRFLAGLVFAVRCGRMSPGELASRLLYFIEAVVVGAWMRREGATHVHTHFSSTVALFVTRLYDVTYSATIHGSGEFVDPDGGFCMQPKVAGARWVCAISDFGRSQIMRHSAPADWHKIEVHRLGIDTDRFAPTTARRPDGTVRLLCVGSLYPVKGHLVLIDAVAAVTAAGRDVELRIVGDGPMRTEIERACEDRGIAGRVRLLGSLGEPDVLRQYAEADVFVLASFAEGLPVVLLEAMSMEIPCIAPWITGIPELISSGKNGLLVCPGRADSLAGAIAALCDAPELRQSLGAAARSTIVEMHSLGRNAEALRDCFNRHQNARCADHTNPRISCARLEA